MNDFYVNLEVFDDPLHDGTQENPFSINELAYHTKSASTGFVYHICGSLSISGFFARLSGYHSYVPWDLISRGPWRIYDFDQLVAHASVISGAIIVGNGTSFNIGNEDNPLNMYNCYCRTYGPIIPFKVGGAAQTYVSGSTFMIDSADFTIQGQGVALKDSIVMANFITQKDDATLTASRCVFSCPAKPTYATATECQWGLDIGGYPAFEAPRPYFRSVAVLKDVTTPPRPGTLPYTNYETGLWGTPRKGIGALDFSEEQ